MTDKIIISHEEYYSLSLQLAKKIIDSGVKVDYIVPLWRGGSYVAMIIHEAMKRAGIHPEHMPIKVSKYSDDGTTHDIKIDGLNYFIQNVRTDQHILLVDDIVDSGESIKAVCNELMQISNVRIHVASLHKTAHAKISPDFFVSEVNQWVNYPHEIADLSDEELQCESRKDVLKILENI